MTEEKLEKIIRRLEESPEQPYMCLNQREALEASDQLQWKYRDFHLVMMRGICYLTVTDAALRVILDQLERERMEQYKILERYDRELAGIAGLLGGENGKGYWSEVCPAPAPSERRWTGGIQKE